MAVIKRRAGYSRGEVSYEERIMSTRIPREEVSPKRDVRHTPDFRVPLTAPMSRFANLSPPQKVNRASVPLSSD